MRQGRHDEHSSKEYRRNGEMLHVRPTTSAHIRPDEPLRMTLDVVYLAILHAQRTLPL